MEENKCVASDRRDCWESGQVAAECVIFVWHLPDLSPFSSFLSGYLSMLRKATGQTAYSKLA